MNTLSGCDYGLSYQTEETTLPSDDGPAGPSGPNGPGSFDGPGDDMSDMGMDNEQDGPSGPSGPDTSDDEETETDDPMNDPQTDLDCVDEDMGTALGNVVAMGSTRGQGDDYMPTCGSSQAEDVALAWTAPEGGCYRVDTNGSMHDTVMMLQDGCDGSVLACNDDFGSGYHSGAVVSLERDTELVVVVDGYDMESGEYVININPDVGTGINMTSWLEDDLGSELGTNLANGQSTYTNTPLGSCASGSADVIFAWTAPETATYNFSTTNSDFDTVLSLWSLPGHCGSIELACDDDGSTNYTSSIEHRLQAGETVHIAIGGYSGESGEYRLSIRATG